MMTSFRQTQFQERLAHMNKNTVDLDGDVDRLTEALQLHHELRDKQKLKHRKEGNASVWEHGAEGRLKDYKSTKYADHSTHPPVKPSSGSVRPKQTPKSAAVQSRSRTVSAGSKVRMARNGTPDEKSATSSMGPSVSKIACQKAGARPESSKKKLPPKATPKKPGQNSTTNGVKGELSSARNEDDIRSIASRFAGVRVSLNETYTKGNAEGSIFKLPVAPEQDDQSTKDTSAAAPEKRAKMLKKMIRKLDVDMKLGEYRTSETDSDSLSTPRTKSATSSTTTRYCDADVLAWLMNQGLKDMEKCSRIFAEHELDLASLAMLTENQLREMGINSPEVLAKLTNSIVALRKSTVEKKVMYRSLSADAGAVLPKTSRAKLIPDHRPNTLHMCESDEKRLYEPYQRKTPVEVSHDNEPRAVSSMSKQNQVTKSSRPSSKPTGAKTAASNENTSKNVARPSRSGGQTATGGSRPRPASAVSPTKTPNKAASVSRPASAIVGRATTTRPATKRGSQITSTHRNPDTARTHPGAKLEVTHSSPQSTDGSPTKRDAAALTGLISVRPLAASHVGGPTSVLSDPSDDDHVAAMDDDPETGLQLVEQQIRVLQQELDSPAAMDIILSLQSQLQHIQKGVLAKKHSAAKQEDAEARALPNLPSPEWKSIKSTRTDKMGGKSPMRSSPDDSDLDMPKVKVREADKEPELPHGVVSMSMSKTELLREVRKQKDAHRKHIRHLESELSRLKHKDPIRNCEIQEEDIHFDVQAKLGEGAFSEVYKGSYQGSDVAVKRLKVPLSCQDKNYFAAEVSLLRELRHPRVVLLMGVCSSAQHALMVLEYMAHGSLYQYLHQRQNAQFDHAAYYQISKDMALGMNYLHRHNPVVLHLDLKSMNVLLTTHLRAKIADFGFSKLRHDADQVISKNAKGQTKGTPAWMAPELLNTGDMSTKSDVYSFSIILWEMLTRKHPYQGCSIFQVIEKTRTNKRLEIPAHCPIRLHDLIARCWNQNPARRPSFKDVLSTLDKLQLPEGWRSLFAQVGIPKAALEDVQSTRTLIDIVTLTLEDIPKRPDDVPVLDLDDSADDVKVIHDYDEDTFDSEDDWEDVTEDDEDSEACPRNDPRPSNVPKLDLNLSGDHRTTKTRTYRKSVDDEKLQDIEDGEDHFIEGPVSLKPASYNPPPQSTNIPPPPPPPPPPLLSNPPSGPKPDLLKHTAIKSKCNVRVSFLEALQSALDERPDVSHLDAHTDDALRPQAQVKHRGDFDLRSSQLIGQKKKLKSTQKPHPCQLRDLTKVPQHTMKDLFSILKKAVDSRRLQLAEGDSLEESMLQSAGWSLGQ